MRKILIPALSILALAAACSDDSSGTNPGNNSITPPNAGNVMALVVDSGPTGSNGSPVGYVNGAFVTVTVCIPGTSNCQDIDHVLVDTGSTGLRLLANDGKAGGKLNLDLPPQQDASGNAIAECAQFVDGFTWGPLKRADVRLAGEVASGIPIQVISEASLAVPSSCQSVGLDEDTLEGDSGLFANGILGVGVFIQDCGEACAIDPTLPAFDNPGLYYSCFFGLCVQAGIELASQVVNPVAMFAADNNGVILELPAVADSGAPSATGSLVFGIGTQPNNGLGNATVLPVDATGQLVTIFPLDGTGYQGSFLDSGSNAIYFSSSSTTIAACSDSSESGFYCPATAMSLSALIAGIYGSSEQVNFSVADAASLLATNNAAFGNLGGSGIGTSTQQASTGFDWGMPFFLGRNVFTAIELAATPAGFGPYVAF